jgi:hypothetical protein
MGWAKSEEPKARNPSKGTQRPKKPMGMHFMFSLSGNTYNSRREESRRPGVDKGLYFNVRRVPPGGEDVLLFSALKG